jgi:type II secretory pathway pseudopilin PulG
MSLLETLVVLAVAGLIGSIAYPRLDQAYRVLALRQSVSVLGQDLRQAKAAAVRSGAPSAVVPTADRQGYALFDGRVRALPEGVSINPGSGGVRFFPDGAALGDGFRISGAGRLVAIAADPATGAIVTVAP